MNVLLQILYGCLKAFRIIPKTAQAVIAVWAEQRANSVAFVTVIYREIVGLLGSRINGRHYVAADGTFVVLSGRHRFVLFKGESVSLESVPFLVAGTIQPFARFLCGTGTAASIAILLAVLVAVPSEMIQWQRASAKSTDFAVVNDIAEQVALFALAFHASSASGAIGTVKLIEWLVAVTASASLGKLFLHLNSLGSSARAATFARRLLVLFPSL